MATQSNLAAHRNDYIEFIQVTKKGYLYTVAHPAEAAQLLTPYLTDADQQNIDLSKALALTVPHFGNDTTCGLMEPQRVAAFLRWLADNSLENTGILEQNLFTNELLY